MNKERDLKACLATFDYDLSAVTETWLDSTIGNNEIFPKSCEVFRGDRSRNGRGVLILGDPGTVSRDATRIGTGVKSSRNLYASPDSRLVSTDCPWVSEDEDEVFF